MFDGKTTQWNIVNIFNQSEVVAYTEQLHQGKTGLPVGFHRWYFPTSACTDPRDLGEEEVTYRTLNLQLDVEQPGNLCCDDGGACISSSLVCDGFPDCQAEWCTDTGTGTDRGKGEGVLSRFDKMGPSAHSRVLAQADLRFGFLRLSTIKKITKIYFDSI